MGEYQTIDLAVSFPILAVVHCYNNNRGEFKRFSSDCVVKKVS